MISPTRLIAPGVAIEAQPLSYGTVSVYRGALLPAPASPARSYREAAHDEEITPVIVRLIHAPLGDEVLDAGEVREVFARVTADRRADENPGPRQLRTLGARGVLLASVEEFLPGDPVSHRLRALRQQGQRLPVPVALAIARALLPLWPRPAQGPLARGRISLDLDAIHLLPSGRVRARPSYDEERSRQVVGAAILHFDAAVAYTPPEQLAGASVDERGDMFVLGLLLYELIAGIHPARREGQSLFQVMTSLLRQPLPRLSRDRPDAHPAVVSFVQRCLDRSPDERFATWDDLTAALLGLQALFPKISDAELGQLAAGDHAPPAVETGLLDGTLPWLEEMPIPPAPPRPLPPHRVFVLDADASYTMPDARPMFLAAPALRIDARPVTQAEFERFLLATGTPAPPHFGAAGLGADDPCSEVPYEAAAAYARWAGKRLPTEEEWQGAVEALGPGRLAVGLVWEWTATPWPGGGQVVRGGRWRDQPGSAPLPHHRSFVVGAAPDVGFRCVRDV